MTCCSWTRSPSTGGIPGDSALVTGMRRNSEIAVRQVEDLASDVVQVERLEDGVLFPQQRAQSIDDRAGPLVVLDDVVERRAQLAEIQRLRSRDGAPPAR